MTRCALIVLYCRDIAQSHRFYRALGIPFVWEQHTEGGHIHWSATLNGLALELYPASERHPPTRGLRLGFSVENLVLVTANPEVAARLHGRPSTRQDGLMVTARDPDNNVVELIQPITPT